MSGVGVSQAEVSLRPNPSSDSSRELFYAAASCSTRRTPNDRQYRTPRLFGAPHNRILRSVIEKFGNGKWHS